MMSLKMAAGLALAASVAAGALYVRGLQATAAHLEGENATLQTSSAEHAQAVDLLNHRLSEQEAEADRRDALLAAASAARARLAADLNTTQRRLNHALANDDCAGLAVPAGVGCLLAPAGRADCGGDAP